MQSGNKMKQPMLWENYSVHTFSLPGLLTFLLLTIFSCKSEISPPSIHIHNMVIRAGDELIFQIAEQITYEGMFYDIEDYFWSIENEKGTLIEDDFPNAAQIKWTPTAAGYYFVKIEVYYNNGQSLDSRKSFYAEESPKSMQFLIAGEWEGHAVSSLDGEWNPVIRLDSSGICTAENDPVFKALSYDCQGIYIDQINNNSGSGRVVWVDTWIYNYNLVWECYDNRYFLSELVIDKASDDLHLKFVATDGDTDFVDYYLKRRVTR
jgi:hypothetical protein